MAGEIPDADKGSMTGNLPSDGRARSKGAPPWSQDVIAPKPHLEPSHRETQSCSRSSRRWFRAALAATLSLPVTADPTLLAQRKPSQYEVEAAYLFNFGKFVRHAVPAQTPGTYDICVVGEDPLGPALDAIIANEQLDGRPVRVRRVKEGAQARACEIAYFSSSEGGHLGRDLSDLNRASVLTVGDSPRFLELGGMIQFLALNDHVRFAINLNAVRKSHLAVSSELLRVAVSLTGTVSPEALP